MLFNSIEFLLFFTVVYSLYLVFSHRWQNRLLIVASCLFYAAWNWKFLGLMFISITTDYLCARNISRSDDPRTRKIFLIICIAVNLSILGFFKYFNFFASSIDGLLRDFHWLSQGVYTPLKIILPLGISFYTFEAISYVVDVYRKAATPSKSYWDYLLFVIYFPHLIAGPIMRAKSFLPQVTQPRTVTLDGFFEGGFLFFWGVFEKVFVADNLAKITNPVFASSGVYEGGQVLLALYAFSFQIFCDFDGYSNMARGLGKCMGFELAVNFRLPYFAADPREFWQRWHITLSTWLRDYLYIPLGGSRQGKGRMYMALIVTMLLGGLWHGAAWTFVLWGLYHGVLLVGHRLVSSEHKEHPEGLSPLRVLKVIVFFHLVVLGWLLFRAQSIPQVGAMLKALFVNFDLLNQDAAAWSKLVMFISPLLAVQFLQGKSGDLLIIYRQHWLLKKFIYALMVYLLIGWGVMKSEEFIYFQF